MDPTTLVTKHVEAALAEAGRYSISDDVVGRCLLSAAIQLFRQHRPMSDIAAELTAAIDNLDEDEPLAFIRP